MIKIIKLLVVCFFVFSLSNADALNAKPTRQAFVSSMLAAIVHEDEQINQDRILLTHLYQQWSSGAKLDVTDLNWLSDIAKQYQVDDFDINDRGDWNTLLRRVDIVPVSLALAQAINESAWGVSRFALEGNNYFGQWCYVKGCGIVPNKRDADKDFEVRKFTSMQDSVAAYILNLNTNKAYKEFRKVRFQYREQGYRVIGLSLVNSLSSYSQRGQAYVSSLRKIINQYQLSQLDYIYFYKMQSK